MENKISTLKELEEIEKKYDPQLSFREIGPKSLYPAIYDFRVPKSESRVQFVLEPYEPCE